MQYKKTITIALAGTAMSLLAGLMVACGTTEPAIDAGMAVLSPAQESTKSGADLWARTCIRCHNSRSPSSYTDAQWQVAMHHMRNQAGLTAEDAKLILEFLQAAN